MAINVFISCARKSSEKASIKEFLSKNPNIGHIYDCNDTPTDYARDITKQAEIDRYIKECTDWFIFICPFDFVGEATFHELKVAVQAKQTKTGLPMISLFFSNNPELELSLCNQTLTSENKIIQRTDDVSRDQINSFLDNNQIKESKRKRYDPDHHEHGFLLDSVNDEFSRFLNHQFRMRRYETMCSEVTPTDIFFDNNRTKEENGFSEAVFLQRPHDVEMIKSSNNHIILCGAPASGKSRSVYEYIKYFGNSPYNKFISVRGAMNLKGQAVGHRFITLSQLTNDLKSYDSYLDRENLVIKAEYKQRNFIVIDQIDSMLGDDLSKLEEIFYYATSERRPSYQIIMTTTPSGYNANRELFDKMEHMVSTIKDGIQSTIPLKTIHITNPTYNDALWIWNQLGDKNRQMPRGKVIGDYIAKLSSYNNRLIDEARHFHSCFSSDIIPVEKSRGGQNSVAAFVRSVQLVRIMRHFGQLPLCLIAMTMKEELWQSIKETKSSETGVIKLETTFSSPDNKDFIKSFTTDFENMLFHFFIHNNIIALSKEPAPINQTIIDDNDDLAIISNIIEDKKERTVDVEACDLCIDYRLIREYDSEFMTTIIDPTITMTIVNDQVWDLICSYSQYDFNTYRTSNGKYIASSNSRKEALRAMNIWYNAFGKENPVTTQLRLLTRSPLEKLDKLQGKKHIECDDNNYSFIFNLFYKELNKRNSITPEEREKGLAFEMHPKFNFLYTLLVARMNNIKKIRATITKNDGTFRERFVSFDMIGELYGQAFEKSKSLGFDGPQKNDEYCILADELFTELQKTNHNSSIDKYLFYYFRQLQIIPNYEKAKDYFIKNGIDVLIKKVMLEDTTEKNHDEVKHTKQSCEQVMFALAKKITKAEYFPDWLGIVETCNADITFIDLSAIIHNSVYGRDQHELFITILNIVSESLRMPDKHITLSKLVHQYGAIFIGEMLKMVPSLVSAREILNITQSWLEDNLIIHTKETREIWESTALSQCQPYEFNYLLSEIMNKEDGSIKPFWRNNRVLRESLLKCSSGNFSNTWELYHRLYRNTDNSDNFEVTPYVFMNIFKGCSNSYLELANEEINRTYENFMQMLDDHGIRKMLNEQIESGEFIDQDIFLKIYDTIVTKKQELHFRCLLGETAWTLFCKQEKVNVYRIIKKHIYNIDDVIRILMETTDRQLKFNDTIDDSLFNHAVNRLKQEINNKKDFEKLHSYLCDLVSDNSEYQKRLIKSDWYYKSMYFLGYKNTPTFNNNKIQKRKNNYWIYDGYSLSKELKAIMEKISVQTISSEEDVDLLFDKLDELYKYPTIFPDISLVLLLLRNRLPNKNDRTPRDLSPNEILYIVESIFCYRGLPITTSIINGILEGFANYFVAVEESPKINKITAWNDFQLFINNYASYVIYDDITYHQLLNVWPDKINLYKEAIDKVCHFSERLLNTVIKLKSEGASIPNEWEVYYNELREIIGQKDREKNATIGGS